MEASGNRYVEIVFTNDDPDETRRIARELVASRLVACAQIVPDVTSIYRWQGKIEEARELQVILKTRALLRQKVCEAILSRHHYDVPEILVREVAFGNPDYEAWVNENTPADA